MFCAILIIRFINAFEHIIAILVDMGIRYWYRKLFWYERIIMIAAGLLLIYPEKFSDWTGLGIFIVMFVIQFLSHKKGNHHDNTKDKMGASVS